LKLHNIVFYFRLCYRCSFSSTDLIQKLDEYQEKLIKKNCNTKIENSIFVNYLRNFFFIPISQTIRYAKLSSANGRDAVFNLKLI